MQYKCIPNTHLSPSTICLGIALFGTDVDEVTSFGILDTFFEHGGTFLDTAHAYGEWVPDGIGQSERVNGSKNADYVSEWFSRQKGGSRMKPLRTFHA